MARLLNTTFSSYNRPLIGFMEAELQRSLKRSLWYIIVYSLSAVAPPAGGRGGGSLVVQSRRGVNVNTGTSGALVMSTFCSFQWLQ